MRPRATRSPHTRRGPAPSRKTAGPGFLPGEKRWGERGPAQAAPRLPSAHTERRNSRPRGVGRCSFHKKRSAASAIMLTEPYQWAISLARRDDRGSARLSGPEHSIGQYFADGSLEMPGLGKDLVL